MTICQGHKKNLDTVVRAAKNGDLCLMECVRNRDGVKVALLCACWRDKDGSFEMVPFAEMVNDPYTEYTPPDEALRGDRVEGQ